MQFIQQITTVPQLYTAVANGDAIPGTLLYLLPQSTPDLPVSIGFADSWSSYPGTYLFLAQPLAAGSEASFAVAAWTFLADPRMQTTRFVWFNPPDGAGLLSGTTIAVYQPDGASGFATAFAATFPFGSVTLFMAARTAVAPDETNFAFLFSQPDAQSIYLTAGWGAATIDGIGATVTLPFSGALAGCLQCTLQTTLQQLTALDVGLRYFYAVPPDSTYPDTPASDGSFFLASLCYPIFAQGLALYANLDPLAPLNGARTFFAFNGSDAGQASSSPAPAVASYFSSTLGGLFSLQPLAGSQAVSGFAALVFASNQQANVPTPRDPFYLVPSGDFALVSPSGVPSLMCGLSGVEYITLDTSSNLISFFPGCAAFASGFFPGQSPGFTNLQPMSTPTTAFATITNSSLQAPQGLSYFAQPDQSILYNYSPQAIPGVTTITPLTPVPVLAGTLVAPPTSALVFPLLPYAGLYGQDLACYQQLESQIVSPTRRLALTQAPQAPSTAPEVAATTSTYSVTPQGLLATYVTGSSPLVWDEIILATSSQNFSLTNVQGKLLSAFQSNKLFLVIANPAMIQDALQAQNALITIGADAQEQWTFDLDPTPDPTTGSSYWQDFGTILIIKFRDMSIADLAQQPSTWNFGDYFNESAAATSATITQIIGAANPNVDSDFTTFHNVVTDPNWNGILMLNVRTPLQQLPAELAGLAVGIDQSQFFAHHVGVSISQIGVQSGTSDLSNSSSSIFGLINYTAAPLSQNGADYQFQVQQLKVRFQNSAVATFSSVIDLQINTLFGEAATLSGGDDNIVQLQGVYQQHTVNGQVFGLYTFQTQSGQNSNFAIQSKVLNTVTIAQGQFVTVYPIPLAIAQAVRVNGTTTITTSAPHGLSVGDSFTISGVNDPSFDGQFTVTATTNSNTLSYAQSGQPDTTSSGGTVRATRTVAQFVFWGLLDFAPLPGLDIFSFGRPNAPIAAAGAVRTSGTTTITTTTQHGLSVGDTAVISGVSDSSFNGTITVAATPSATTLSYAQSGQPDGSSGGGTVVGVTPAGLNFSNLLIGVTFDPAASPPTTQFTFDASQLSFDLAGSTARTGSLFNHFPLTVGGFVQASPGTTPTSLGYMSVQTPLNQSAVAYPWYALNFNLNLGSPGALAAQAGFVASLTAAWSPNLAGDYTVFTGLKLPGASGAKRAISVEGLFNITFKTLEIIALPDSDTFILVLYDIGFQFMSFSFPPTGQINFVLFGDPINPGAGANGDTSLGWYAAYVKPNTQGSGGTSSAGMLARPRPQLVDVMRRTQQ